MESSTPICEEELLINCHVHLFYLGNGVYGQLKRKPYSQNLHDPITEEHLSEALMKIRGVGRPRANPLDLSLPKDCDTDQQTAPEQPVNVELTSEDRQYLNCVISNICMPNEPLNQSDSSFLFNLYITPPGNGNTNDVNIAGQNAPNSVNHDHGYSLPQNDQLVTSDTNKPAEIAKGDNLIQNEANIMKGQNDAVPVITDMEGQNQQQNNLEPNVNASNSELNLKETSEDNTICDESDVNSQDGMNVSNTIQELWKSEALKNNSYVPLKRMSRLDIYDMTRKQVDWDNIDPYSSLEEETGDSFKEMNRQTSDEAISEKDEKPVIGTIYLLRERCKKTVRHSTHPQRSTRVDMDYSKMDLVSDTDSPKRRKRKPPVPSYPSADRQAAQKLISGTKGEPMPFQSPETDRKRRFYTKNPERAKPTHRRSTIRTRSKSAQDIDTIDDNTDETTPPPMPVPSDPVKSKGTFNTTSHVLAKHTTIRYFKCPVCGMHKTTILKLNTHFKRRHPPMSCEKCAAVFHTPSSLAHHRYTHEQPKHKCDNCGKAFFFPGELKQHRTKHLKTCMHVCNHGNCRRSFKNNPDLLKHVRTHTNTPQQCPQCDYTTTDPRLYKNHQALHTDDLPFKCTVCNKQFKHRNQLRRHKMDPKLCNVCSGSPEF